MSHLSFIDQRALTAQFAQGDSAVKELVNALKSKKRARIIESEHFQATLRVLSDENGYIVSHRPDSKFCASFHSFATWLLTAPDLDMPLSRYLIGYEALWLPYDALYRNKFTIQAALADLDRVYEQWFFRC